MSFDQVKALLERSIALSLQTLFPELDTSLPVVLESPKEASHGDLACTSAMGLAKILKQNPRQIADKIKHSLQANTELMAYLDRIEVAGAGFMNVTFKPIVWHAVGQTILGLKDRFGYASANQQCVIVEFVSANPTGPLHVGHARQAALGDAIASLYQTQGYQVIREFYYNDAGQQIENLALSVQARARGILPDSPQFPADGYRGEYIESIAQAYLNKDTVSGDKVSTVAALGDINDIEAIRAFAVAYLRREQELDLAAFGLSFDVYSLESALYTSGKVDQVVQALTKANLTYEQDGALWLRTSEFGDDKDRVMRKADGAYTYFVPDLAYHLDKKRRCDWAVNVQGMDHHGTIARVRAGLQGLAGEKAQQAFVMDGATITIPDQWPQYVLHKMVTVMRDGVEVKISKRAGSYVTLRDLIDWAGRDAVRFFLSSRKADTEFVFDVNLAQEQSENNPVFYVQYAHARICAVIDQAKQRGIIGDEVEIASANWQFLVEPEALSLLRWMNQYPTTLSFACEQLSPHLIAFFVRDLAQKLHSFYNAHRVLVDDKELCLARLALLLSVRQVIANGLSLLGVSAPNKM